MSKKNKKSGQVAKAETKKQGKKPAPKVGEILEKVGKGKAPAAKKEAAKITPEKTEKAFVPKDVPEACELVIQKQKSGIFGAFDATSSACKECQSDYPETAKACEFNTKAQAAVKKAKKSGGGGGKRGGEKSPLGHSITSGAGKIDLALLRKDGATMAELDTYRGCAGNHLNYLKKHGVKIEKKGDRYFATLPKKAA